MRRRSKKKIYFILIVIAILIIAGFLFWKFGGKSFEIDGSNEAESANKGEINPITGLECENHDRRPIAVMLATDPQTRPLSGISKLI